MATERKHEIISFKVDESLARALEGIENRSQFIRTAVLTALDSVCPLCSGTGVLTPTQQRHWEQFAKRHTVHKCASCDAMHLVCSAAGETEEDDHGA